MIKAIVFIVIGCLLGLGVGSYVHQARYGVVAEFGPFATTNDVKAADVVQLLTSLESNRGAPKLEVVGGEEFDFGVMEPGTKGEHTFVVKNTGTAPMTLEVIGSTCKCTIGKLDKSELQPGEETNINLTWDVKSTSEQFGQSAILKSNDPIRGEFHLKVKGTVISQMTMVPRTLSFGQVESGENIKLEGILYSFLPGKVVPVKQSFSDEQMTKLAKFNVAELDVKKITDTTYASAKQAFKVEAEIAPGLPQEAIQQNFVFEFAQVKDGQSADDVPEADRKKFLVSVSGRIVGAITMVESSKCQTYEGGYVYSMGRLNPETAEPENATIMLRGKYRDSLKLQLGEVEPAGLLNAELGEPKGRGTVLLYPLKLWVNKEAKEGERLGKSDDDFGIVWIKTDNPDIAPLRLKVRFAIDKQK